MPELKCTVQTCRHNKNFLCDLDRIQVGGSDAKQGDLLRQLPGKIGRYVFQCDRRSFCFHEYPLRGEGLYVQ